MTNDAIIPPTLDDVWESIWADLIQGVIVRKHPYHTAVLGTAAHGADLRIVVVRQVDREAGRIRCHTDIRSPKIAEIQQNPQIGWLLYNPIERKQIRLRGTATIHHLDITAQTAWDESTLLARRCYCGFAPGSNVAEAHSGLPENLQGRQPTEAESVVGWPHFAVLECEITHIDWLWLHFDGHVRAQFRRSLADSAWESHWVTP